MNFIVIFTLEFCVAIDNCEWLGWWSWSGTSLWCLQDLFLWGGEPISVKHDTFEETEENWMNFLMWDAQVKIIGGQVLSNSRRNLNKM